MWISIVAIAVIVAAIALAIFSIVRDKKKGKCSCGNSCSSCGMSGACHSKK
ncbi:MAG: FeoB-associated Cys-rich membrane protein [Clostridia bacterium]|nr:FeoB-associated Cys-rich membrane protein [Clostridia bacterium]